MMASHKESRTMGLWDNIQNTFGFGSGDPSNSDRNGVRTAGQNLSAFGNQAATGYGNDTAALASQQQYLNDLMQGKNSVSAEQLRQGLQQQMAQQQAMAAGAAPQNQAMAARSAMMNMGRASYGMTGQQALAGLQERNQAAQQLAQLNLGMRGQDLQGTLGGYGGSANAYGNAMTNPQKTGAGLIGGAIGGLASGIPGLGGMLRGGGGGQGAAAAAVGGGGWNGNSIGSQLGGGGWGGPGGGWT